MTNTPGSTPPFPGFPGFPPGEMLDRMWDMMRLTPFGSAFHGTPAGATPGLGPSLSMMSDMMAPLTNVEELDKRITDMRAVEQWLKLNLNMLQSAIQALEVQRATLATLRAFGAFAQQSMAQPAGAPTPAPEKPHPAAAATPRPEAASSAEPEAGENANAPAFDASAWWNLLQSQFNQIAQFAMTQPAAAAAAESSVAGEDSAQAGAAESAGADKPSEKESVTKRASAARPSSGTASRPRATKKTPSQPE
ncbi:MAG: PhaM family polyhydroxyalkanoate granule multifunctional regulatory protein [Paraburkholderia sp.]|jgi:hypothetical protein